LERVAVVGNSGSGKSVLAARLARCLGVAHIELDAMFHLADWQELPEEAFRAQVLSLVAAEGWVVDGNYAAVRELVWERADTVVWLDLPRHVVMRRVTWRTLSRMLLARRLWNGNRERVRHLFSTNPEQSIILWSWTKHAEYRQRYAAAMTDARWSHLRFVRIASTRAAERLVAETASGVV
jgi:adenylate kinase family enzyme